MIDEILNHEYGQERTSLKPARGPKPSHEVLELGNYEERMESYKVLRARQNAIHKETTKGFINE